MHKLPWTYVETAVLYLLIGSFWLGGVFLLISDAFSSP